MMWLPRRVQAAIVSGGSAPDGGMGVTVSRGAPRGVSNTPRLVTDGNHGPGTPDPVTPMLVAKVTITSTAAKAVTATRSGRTDQVDDSIAATTATNGPTVSTANTAITWRPVSIANAATPASTTTIPATRW